MLRAASTPVAEMATHLDAGELYRRHAKFVSDFLWRLGLEPQELEDALHEVFVVAHRRGGFVPREAKATTWLAEIAIHVAAKARRHHQRHPERPDSPAVAAALANQSSSGDLIDSRDRLARVRQALGRMDLDLRAVFLLYELEGESCEDIAVGFGIAVGTVYSRLHSARRQLLDWYQRLERSRPLAAGQEADLP